MSDNQRWWTPPPAQVVEPPAPDPLFAQHARVIGAGGVLTAIWLGACTVAGWPVVVALRSPGPPLPAAVLAHLAGMLAGYGVLVLLLLMSRAPILEREIGADVLARWHSRGGRLVISAIVVHGWAAIMSWAQSRNESAALSFWHVLLLPYLTAAALGTVLLIAVGAVSVRTVRRRVSFERWHALHLLTYVGIALSFLHQLDGPDLAGHVVLQVGWALLYTSTFGLLLRYRVLTPLRQAARHRLRVVAARTETAGIITFDVEGQHLAELSAESGQFFRWRFLTPDTWATAHPFSLSAAPTDTRLRLTVKALGDGSRHLQKIPIGTWVIAEGPYGAMTAARRSRRDVLLIAGGVGITPMRALFETFPLQHGQDLMLLYRAHDAERLLFRAELDSIAQRRGARVHYLLGHDPHCLSAASLTGLVPHLLDRDVYLCGPPRMTDSVRTALRAAGLPRNAIHEERFAL